jgi:hypothetical protein
MPTQRLIASGHHISARGGFALTVSTNAMAQVQLTALPGFAFSPNNHTHYLLGGPAVIGCSTWVPPAAGNLWILTSTNPPGIGVWPSGYKLINLTTTDVHQSGHQTGTMIHSATGAAVYIAKNLLVWIPNAAWVGNIIVPGLFGAPVVVPPLPAPTAGSWDIDF